MFDDNLEALMALIGTSDEDSLEVQLQKFADFYSKVINEIPALKMDNSEWKLTYIDSEVKLSKMCGDNEVAYITFDGSGNICDISDKNDADIKKMAGFIVL